MLVVSNTMSFLNTFNSNKDLFVLVNNRNWENTFKGKLALMYDNISSFPIYNSKGLRISYFICFTRISFKKKLIWLPFSIRKYLVYEMTQWTDVLQKCSQRLALFNIQYLIYLVTKVLITEHLFYVITV
jgi:hypothetical protein